MIPVDLYLNAIILLALIGGVLGLGFKTVANNKKDKKE